MSIQEKPSATASKAIDLSHHLSDSGKRRTVSPLKGLQKYARRPGMINLAGGMYFVSPYDSYPFSSIRSGGWVMVRNARSHLLSFCIPYCGGFGSRCFLRKAFRFFSFRLVLEHLWCIHSENWALYYSQVWSASGRHRSSHRVAVL